MTKYWAFARGGAWRNPKPTGGPYVCEQCRLDEQVRKAPLPPQPLWLLHLPRIIEELRRRLVAELESVRKYLRAAAVKIPLRPQARYQIATLPPDIDLQPGRLRVEFDGVEDLLAKLFELAHSAAQDFERFRNAVESAQNSQKV